MDKEAYRNQERGPALINPRDATICILYRFIYGKVGRIRRISRGGPLIIYDFGRKSNLAFRFGFLFLSNLSQWFHLRKWKCR